MGTGADRIHSEGLWVADCPALSTLRTSGETRAQRLSEICPSMQPRSSSSAGRSGLLCPQRSEPGAPFRVRVCVHGSLGRKRCETVRCVLIWFYMTSGWLCHPLDRLHVPPMGEAGSLEAGQTTLGQPGHPGVPASMSCEVECSSWACAPGHAASPGVPAGPRCRRGLRPPRTSLPVTCGAGRTAKHLWEAGRTFWRWFCQRARAISCAECRWGLWLLLRVPESPSHAGGGWEREEGSGPDSCTRPSCTEQGMSGRQPAAPRPYKNIPRVPVLP